MIYDGDLEIAHEAARRWLERSDHRQSLEGRSQAEIESPERVQKRLDRLTRGAIRGSAPPMSEAVEQALPAMVETIGFERILGDPDFRGIAFLEMALAVSRFVGRVHVRSAPTRTSGFGTGFMVSPRLLLTNNHVIASPEEARFSEVEFDFQNDRFQRPLPVVPFALEPGTFFLTSRELDFTLVAVAPASRGGVALKRYGWSRLIADEGKALIGDPLNIIQHPRGQLKQIVFRSNHLVDLPSPFAHYTTDTEPGSSGSPVYNDQWELVALHHSGVPRTDRSGNLIARDGSVWSRGDDPEDLDWVANEGIRVSFLVRAMEEANLRGEQNELRRELLDLQPPDPLEAAAQADEPAAGAAQPAPSSRMAPEPGARSDRTAPLAGGSATIELPLRITFSLGAPGGLEHPSVAVGASEPPPPVAPDGPQAAPPPPPPTPEARAALAELEHSTTRPYYDERADAAARDAYWRGIDPADHSPDQAFHAVHEHLRRTHQRPLPYKPAQHVYPWVDLRPGPRPTLKSIYSGKGFDPRELIESEFAMLQEFGRRVSEGLVSPGEEADLPYNCEHVVPLSWFRKREPMRGDLHHLFTCEMRCNSFRSNTPFFDFPDFEEAIRDDCGKSERNKFEPSAGKGAAARATLYFLLRYPGEIDATADEYEPERLDTLLAWHRRSPPDEWERHRNAAIQEKQGNRNPLIDHPEWAEQIDFAQGLGSGPGHGGSEEGSGENRSMMDAAQLSSHLWNTAVREAEIRGLRLGDGAGPDMRRHAENAAMRVMDEAKGDLASSAGKVALARAEAAFELLVRTMSAARAEVYVAN